MSRTVNSKKSMVHKSTYQTEDQSITPSIDQTTSKQAITLNTPNKVVADIFALVAKNIHIKPGTGYEDKHITYKNENIYFAQYHQKPGYPSPSLTVSSTEYFESCFSQYSLIDLKNVMYLVFPFSTDYNGNGSNKQNNHYYVSTLDYVKFIIKYIEKEIDSYQICGNGNNNNSDNSDYFLLLQQTQELQNSYDALKSKYDAMRGIMNT